MRLDYAQGYQHPIAASVAAILKSTNLSDVVPTAWIC